MALEFTDDNIKGIVNSGQPVVIDFWAEWCGPCRMIGPSIEELSKEYEGKVQIGKMNVDDHVDTPSEYGIRNIPTILFIKDGQVVDKQVGAVPKAVLEEKVKALL
ncbi:MAG TPA: thioredoxin [Paludibacter sp.]|jgi:thioredoxin 1|nr:MAG: Thioredoxin [Bacteroidetes bacterium ADurb.Bin174]HQB28632.1 thioredoxin [Paludibacter sp.]